eukprot:CAMPEP_0205824194 /NCGR_PEP_ID=MMETSP0206-20130828/19897_1 /ASSEMBLY_ACC=CAM_ASM_000279 /TAXON_ID=36767 /ORGANISM="Euplotes focardii, Strain TN1" /LENGTH=319 /DNA_ID=CAMNT_0053122093 /DNA_START=35 /DNA_END=994 /DNA_ORIENTATION=+
MSEEKKVVDDAMVQGDLHSIEICNEGYPVGNLGPKDELLAGDGSEPRRFKRKVVRRVEVPHRRKVKVPVVTKEVIECEIEQRVAVKKAVEVVDYEEVEEEYTEYVDQPATREKEVWKETTVEKLEWRERPVQKTRKVKRPITRIVEEDHYQVIRVPSTKVEKVDVWRIDEYTEWKMVELVDYEVYDLIAHNKVEDGDVKEEDLGPVVTRDLGTIASDHTNRIKGTKIYTQDHVDRGEVEMGGVELDNAMDQRTMAQLAGHTGQSYSSAAVLTNEGAGQALISDESGAAALPAPASESSGRRSGSRRRRRRAVEETPESF